ncbi:MAG: hypothetical protein ACOY0T_03075 [Myxococcota bacterium]
MRAWYGCILGLVTSLFGLASSVPDARADAVSHEKRTRPRFDVKRRCEMDPRVRLGQISLDVCVGGELFFREKFQGNGRTCGSCHPANNNYTIDTAFISKLPDHDPLFISEQNPYLTELEVPELLRELGLIRVNADGFDDLTNKFVMRSVPHMLGLAASITAPPLDTFDTTHATDGTLLPPLERLGWSGDGSPGEGRLRDFADGAITQHMTRSLQRRPGTDFVLPNDAERDAMAAFSGSIGRMEDIDLNVVSLTDLGAEVGRNTFLTGAGSECGQRCHLNAGANAFTLNADNVPQPASNVSLDIGTALVRHPLVDELAIPIDGGFGTRPLDADGDGVDDSFGNGGMNVPPLIEAADTAPMFHSNAFETLEDAIAFYASQDFADSFIAHVSKFDNRDFGQAMPLSPQDIADLGRFLRVLNASLNCQMASYRLSSAIDIVAEYGDRERRVTNGLVDLTRAELEDALEVLGAVTELHRDGQQRILRALLLLRWADWQGGYFRMRTLRYALELIREVEQSFGTGLKMKLGAGTLMF